MQVKLEEEVKNYKVKEDQLKKDLLDLKKTHADDINHKQIELDKMKKKLHETTEKVIKSNNNLELLQNDNKSMIDKVRNLESNLKEKSNEVEVLSGKLQETESSLEAYKNMKESHDQLLKDFKVKSEKFKTNKKVSETIISQKDNEIELLKKSLNAARKESSVASSSKRKRLETDNENAHSKKHKSMPRQELQ